MSRIFLVTLLAALPASAARRYVDSRVAVPGNGSSWATAFARLEDALAVSGGGDEVWVATGTYSGGFVVPAGVTVWGGLAAGDADLLNRQPLHKRTVLDGGSARRVLNLGEGSVVDGCIVQNGLATGDGGGGALMNGVSATIRNCVFQDCANSGGRGSALRIVNAANPTVVNSIFTGNRADGHVIDLDASGGLYAHLVVAYNVSNGLHFQLGSSPRIYNCVFAGNTNLGICHISANDQPMLRNNAFFANTAGLYFHVNQTYTTIAQVNALPFAADNLDADPAFADALARSFLLGPRSPLIDRGVDLPGIDRDLMLLPRRFDDPRFMGPGGTADVGAHEWSGSLLRPFGTPAPGNVVWLVIAAPNEPFRTFQMASSLGTGPIDLGGRKLALGFDPLLVLSVGGVLPEVFVGYPGILDGSGDSAAALVIPGSPALRGLVLHSAAVVQGPGGLGSISNTATITIQ